MHKKARLNLSRYLYTCLPTSMAACAFVSVALFLHSMTSFANCADGSSRHIELEQQYLDALEAGDIGRLRQLRSQKEALRSSSDCSPDDGIENSAQDGQLPGGSEASPAESALDNSIPAATEDEQKYSAVPSEAENPDGSVTADVESPDGSLSNVGTEDVNLSGSSEASPAETALDTSIPAATEDEQKYSAVPSEAENPDGSITADVESPDGSLLNVGINAPLDEIISNNNANFNTNYLQEEISAEPVMLAAGPVLGNIGIIDSLQSGIKRWYSQVDRTYGEAATDANREAWQNSELSREGLFSTDRNSRLSQGVRQVMINGGVPAEAADEIIKRIEAEGSEDRRFAQSGTRVLGMVNALFQGASAVPQGTKAAAAAASGAALLGPDPVSYIFNQLIFSQRTQYDTARDAWRASQTIERRMGTWSESPTSKADVRKIRNALWDEQRPLKQELGDISDLKKRYGSDPDEIAKNMEINPGDERAEKYLQLRRLQHEEAMLNLLNEEVADLELINRAAKR